MSGTCCLCSINAQLSDILSDFAQFRCEYLSPHLSRLPKGIFQENRFNSPTNSDLEHRKAGTDSKERLYSL